MPCGFSSTGGRVKSGKRSMLARMLTLLALILAASPLEGLDQIYPQLDALYLDLHKNPELSTKEQRTSARMADELRKLGYEVTAGVGGTGVVGVLRNGKGPTVLLRTELDALPVEEKTGLPYASTATGVNPQGQTVPVMHACGHDVHMAGWTGAAALLARMKDRRRGRCSSSPARRWRASIPSTSPSSDAAAMAPCRIRPSTRS